MCNQNILSGPFQVSKIDVDRDDDLNSVDIGSWFIYVNGEKIFYPDQFTAQQTINLIVALNL